MPFPVNMAVDRSPESDAKPEVLRERRLVAAMRTHRRRAETLNAGLERHLANQFKSSSVSTWRHLAIDRESRGSTKLAPRPAVVTTANKCRVEQLCCGDDHENESNTENCSDILSQDKSEKASSICADSLSALVEDTKTSQDDDSNAENHCGTSSINPVKTPSSEDGTVKGGSLAMKRRGLKEQSLSGPSRCYPSRSYHSLMPVGLGLAPPARRPLSPRSLAVATDIDRFALAYRRSALLPDSEAPADNKDDNIRRQCLEQCDDELPPLRTHFRATTTTADVNYVEDSHSVKSGRRQRRSVSDQRTALTTIRERRLQRLSAELELYGTPDWNNAAYGTPMSTVVSRRRLRKDS